MEVLFVHGTYKLIYGIYFFFNLFAKNRFAKNRIKKAYKAHTFPTHPNLVK